MDQSGLGLCMAVLWIWGGSITLRARYLDIVYVFPRPSCFQLFNLIFPIPYYVSICLQFVMDWVAYQLYMQDLKSFGGRDG